MNPGFFSALDLRSELEGAQAADGSDAAQYLSRVMKRSDPEKHNEQWRAYLHRCLKSSSVPIESFPALVLLFKVSSTLFLKHGTETCLIYFHISYVILFF